jgi:hypothetical protein
MESLRRLVEETQARRAADVDRYRSLDHDLCQICHAHGEDKRSLRIDCGYAVHEVVPEAIDLCGVVNEGRDLKDYERAGYFMNICKACRGDLLTRLGAWRTERVALRELPKDHDGHLDIDTEGLVPVRVNGAIHWLTPDEWHARNAASQ